MEGIDWILIAEIVAAVVLVALGGGIWKLKREIEELIAAFSTAIADGEVTREELDLIIKEAKDVKNIVFELAKLVAKKTTTTRAH